VSAKTRSRHDGGVSGSGTVGTSSWSGFSRQLRAVSSFVLTFAAATRP
jgi:hypothetical protein